MSTNPYAPPNAPVSDIPLQKAGASKQPPHTLVTLLALVIGIKLARAITADALLPTVLWSLLFAALALSALIGKRSAATALGYVFYVAGALSLLSPLLFAQSALGIAMSVAWGLLTIATARYMLKSQEVRAFYASHEPAPQNAG